jgi:hypothetical protein
MYIAVVKNQGIAEGNSQFSQWIADVASTGVLPTVPDLIDFEHLLNE